MKFAGFSLPLVLLAVLAAPLSSAFAASTVYTDYASFQAALSGNTIFNEDYSSYALGANLNDGDTVNRLTYSFLSGGDVPGVTLDGGIATTLFNSISPQSLRGRQSSGAQFFFDGDGVAISFALPAFAVGVLFNVNLDSGVYGLVTSGADIATVGSAAYDAAFPLGSFVFAGLITDTPLNSVSFSSSSGGDLSAS